MSTVINWVIDTLASEDVIDLYFILTDLVEIELSEAEIGESAYFDAMTAEAVREHKMNRKIPLGKLVL